MGSCGLDVVVLHEVPADWTPPADAGVVVSAETYQEPSVSALRSAVEAQVPVLVLADGALEFRNSWRNPRLVDGAVYRPVLGHKLACLGASQCRHVESWGNPGRCELVGFPAFDRYLDHPVPPLPRSGTWRLLVASAKTPFFDAAQRAIAIEQVRALNDALKAFAAHAPCAVEVTWRLTGELRELFGVTGAVQPLSVPIHEALVGADAVIATPSTVVIEAMLANRPVAQLDFFNTPHYQQTAWTISAPSHIEDVLSGLLEPTDARLAFQRASLHDALECRTPARDRMVRLVREMARIGAHWRARGAPLQFPPRILPGPPVDAQSLPGHVDAALDVSAVRLELRHLRRALDTGERAPRSLDGLLASLSGRRPLVIWGTGTLARRLCAKCPAVLDAAVAFADSNPARHGERFLGRPVIGAASLPATAFVLIATVFAGEIEETLQAQGRVESRDFLATGPVLDDPSQPLT